MNSGSMFSCQLGGRKYLSSIWVAKYFAQEPTYGLSYRNGGYLISFFYWLCSLSSPLTELECLHKQENQPDHRPWCVKNLLILLFTVFSSFCSPELSCSLWACYYVHTDPAIMSTLSLENNRWREEKSLGRRVQKSAFKIWRHLRHLLLEGWSSTPDTLASNKGRFSA